MEQCTQQLGQDKPQAGILLVGIRVEHQPLIDRLMQQWPDIQLIGCTTDGETSSTEGTLLESAALMLFTSETLAFTLGTFQQSPEQVEPSLEAALQSAIEQTAQKPTFGIMLADGLLFNGNVLMQVAQKALGHYLPWFGGMAADQWLFSGTKQFYQSRILEGEGAFLLFHGECQFTHAISVDWQAVGDFGRVTRAEGSVVYEIEGMSALNFFHQSLGVDAIPSTNNPIAVYNEEKEFAFLRTCFENFDEETGSMTFIANLPEGYHVRLTVVERDDLITGASQATQRALDAFSGTPTTALCFTCSARRALLGSRIPEEIQAVQQALGDAIPFCGFYTYGEIAPAQSGSLSGIHNETFTILLLE